MIEYRELLRRFASHLATVHKNVCKKCYTNVCIINKYFWVQYSYSSFISSSSSTHKVLLLDSGLLSGEVFLILALPIFVWSLLLSNSLHTSSIFCYCSYGHSSYLIFLSLFLSRFSGGILETLIYFFVYFCKGVISITRYLLTLILLF